MRVAVDKRRERATKSRNTTKTIPIPILNSSADSTSPVTPAVVASAAASPTIVTPVPSSPWTTIHSVSLSDSTATTRVVPVPLLGASDQPPLHAVVWKVRPPTRSHCPHQRVSTTTHHPSWCRTRQRLDCPFRELADALSHAWLGRHESG